MEGFVMVRSNQAAATSLTPEIDISFFEDNILFIRHLIESDEQAIEEILNLQGIEPEEVEIYFGIFNVDYELVDMFKTANDAFEAAATGNCVLLWIQ